MLLETQAEVKPRMGAAVAPERLVLIAMLAVLASLPSGVRSESPRPGSKMLHKAFFHSRQAALQTRAQLARCRIGANIAQVFHQLVVSFRRAVQHEVHPGP